MKINVLVVEDNADDAQLLNEMLNGVQDVTLNSRHVGTFDQAEKVLSQESIDTILLDLSLPDSDGLATVTRMNKAAPFKPIVVLTGLKDEKTSYRAIQEGAQDYLSKNEINPTLLYRTIRYSLARKRLSVKLESALLNMRTLSGLIPVCAKCKRVRDDDGYWAEVEDYMESHTAARIQSARCEDCEK